jgi:competence protein ComEA
MKRFIRSITRFSFVTAVLVFGGILLSFAADLQIFSNGRLIDNPANDGDSFIVEANGRSFHVRLYFVDCPETLIASRSDAQRVREQTRYFGLPDATRAIHFGNEAKIFVDHALVKPFTLHTAFASALGRSSKGRVYGFITTAEGNDLASLLVKNGFARTHGIGRETPDGVSRHEMIERLRDLEVSAMLKRVGIWSESDPDRIAELRAEQRSEDQELKELQSQVKKAQSPQGLLDPNTASKEALESIKGIGPALAERIIAGRPYRTADDLLKVKGIGPKKLEDIRPYFVIGKK